MPREATPAKERALRLLAVRARSREELRRRLARAGHEEEEIASALDNLERAGLVDDQAFARELTTHHLEKRGSGKRAALFALRSAGVDAALAEATVEATLPEDEETRAEELARSRLSRLSNLDEAVAYRRLLGFLQRRGYDGETARNAARKAVQVLGTAGPAV